MDPARLFGEARTFSTFDDRPVPLALLRRLYDHLKWGPTSANSCPARFVFVTSPEGKARLLPCIGPGNVDKVKGAPVTVIVAGDSRFYDLMPKLFPARDFKSVFAGNAAVAADTLVLNVPLQGAYMIIAARALGLDAGPMSGFDAAKLNAEFFADDRWQTNFICNLGYGEPSALHPRRQSRRIPALCDMLVIG